MALVQVIANKSFKYQGGGVLRAFEKGKEYAMEDAEFRRLHKYFSAATEAPAPKPIPAPTPAPIPVPAPPVVADSEEVDSASVEADPVVGKEADLPDYEDSTKKEWAELGKKLGLTFPSGTEFKKMNKREVYNAVMAKLVE